MIRIRFIVTLLIILGAAEAKQHAPNIILLMGDDYAPKAAFEKAAAGASWEEVFSDGGTGDWKAKWFLDGEVGSVTNSPEGMTVEIDTSSYSQATLAAIYLIHDLAEEPELRQLANHYMTLAWALWAEQQIQGVNGGAKTRHYPVSAKAGGNPMGTADWSRSSSGTRNVSPISITESDRISETARIFDRSRDKK